MRVFRLLMVAIAGARFLAAQPPPPFDPIAYAAELERVSTAVAEAEKRPEAAAQLRGSLPKLWSVRQGERQVEVPTAWLDRNLANIEKNPIVKDRAARVREIQARLGAMKEQAEALAAEPAPALGAAGGKLKDILGRREFRSVRDPDWRDRWRRQLEAWILDLLDRTLGRLPISPHAGEYLIWTLIAAALIVLGLWVKRAVERAAAEGQAAEPAAAPRRQAWNDWLQAALAAAARGDYREAVRMSYWAAVARLAETGVWTADPARTPREYLRLLPRGHEHRPALSRLTRRFELAWYGNRPAAADDYRESLSEVEQLGCLSGSQPHPATERS